MNKIINILKKQKSLPLDQFINIALYNKKYGYYMKKNPFGKDGDFITSPMISNLFAEMIALWCVSFWEHLKKPKKILIVELGPGDGSLCRDLLKTFKRFNTFYSCVKVNLLEKSEKLKKIQYIKIKNKKVRWIKSINQIKYGPIIFLGNEFFDALPIKQLCKKNNTLYEKHVILSKNKKKLDFIYKKINRKIIKYNNFLNSSSSTKFLEYPITAIKYLIAIAKKINKFNGSLLICDYGYIFSKKKSTLISIAKHEYKEIFFKPGNTDISSHINFNLFSKVLKKNSLDVNKIVTQSEFLQKMGILERANILSKKMSFKSKANMYYRIKKLLDTNEMGNLFKVLLAQKKNMKFYIGF
jgi:NADH dehydrogenase [ubiquinone] 1 alpha subcomplex assembly factor 7